MSDQPSHVKVIDKPTREQLKEQLEKDLLLLEDLINNPDKWIGIYEAKETYREIMRIVDDRTEKVKAFLAQPEGPGP